MRKHRNRPESDEPLSEGRVEYLEAARQRVRNKRIRRTAVLLVVLTAVVLFATGIAGSSVAALKDLTDTARIALLPGSRRSEIRKCLPTMLAAARNVVRQSGKAYRIVVTAAPSIEDSFYARYLQGEELTRNTYDTVSRARAAVVNSGTATLETALLGCPETAVYYIACSKWLEWLLRPIVFRTAYFTLVNIIPKEEVIQELIAKRFTHENIEHELTRLLTDEAYREQMLRNFDHIAEILGDTPAAVNAAHAIVGDLQS